MFLLTKTNKEGKAIAIPLDQPWETVEKKINETPEDYTERYIGVSTQTGTAFMLMLVRGYDAIRDLCNLDYTMKILPSETAHKVIKEASYHRNWTDVDVYDYLFKMFTSEKEIKDTLPDWLLNERPIRKAFEAFKLGALLKTKPQGKKEKEIPQKYMFDDHGRTLSPVEIALDNIKLEEIPCPKCGSKALRIQTYGDASLCREVYIVGCDDCDWQVPGGYIGDYGEATSLLREWYGAWILMDRPINRVDDNLALQFYPAGEQREAMRKEIAKEQKKYRERL